MSRRGFLRMLVIGAIGAAVLRRRGIQIAPIDIPMPDFQTIVITHEEWDNIKRAVQGMEGRMVGPRTMEITFGTLPARPAPSA